MKKKTILAAAFACFTCVPVVSGHAKNSMENSEPVAPPAAVRTLVCRMGGEMRWSLLNQFDVLQTQINGKTVRVPVIVSLFDQLMFAKSGMVVKPDGSNLQPGQCGFTDRPMSALDPDRVLADNDDFMLQQNVLWGNGSTLRSEATMFGGSLNFQNKQVFSMQVTPLNEKQLKVVAGTKPKAVTGK